MPSRRTGKYDGVQALRLVAALLVVGTHASFYAGQRLRPSATWHFGEVGVDIFFVISGFVMMASSYRHHSERDYWKAFGLRRIIRIVPMYWIATTLNLLLILSLPALAATARPSVARVVLSYLFVATRNVNGRMEPLHGVGWTLVFEMFFYLVFTIGLLLRVNLMWFCGVLFTLCAAGAFLRPDPWPPELVYLDPLLLYFVAGMAIGKWVCDREKKTLMLVLGYLTAVWVLNAALRSSGTGFSWYLLLRPVLSVAVVLVVVLAEPWLRVPKFVIFLGDASYTLYLFHPLMGPLVPVVLRRLHLISVPLSVLLTFPTVLLGSALIYQLVERPITRWLLTSVPWVRPRSTTSAGPPPRGAEAGAGLRQPE